MASERKFFTVKWRIENFWKLSSLLMDSLNSSGFTLNSMGDIRWKLNLMIGTGVQKTFLIFNLERETAGDGPGDVILDIDLSILAGDEFPFSLKKFKNHRFSHQTYSPSLVVEKKDILAAYTGCALPQDLTLRCRMRPGQGPFSEGGRECVAVTRLGVEQKCFNVFVEQLSAFYRGEERRLFIGSASGQIPDFHLNMSLNRKRKFIIEGIRTADWLEKTCSCTFFLLDVAGNREVCAREGVWPGCDETRTFQLNLSKKWLMLNEELYLPKDMLSLCFETKSCAGIELNEIDRPEYRCESSSATRRNSSDQKKSNISYTPQEQVELPTPLMEDLMSMYQDRTFCDTILRTGTETFPAHRIVLSVKSTVFKAMFTLDMKEKSNDHVDIPDLSADTIRRMLLFLYTDTIGEDLDWNAARDLYLAAAKYDILHLKRRCSSFLKKNISTSNVCEILALADMHQDCDLKCSTRNFILGNEKQVFGSKEWKMFTKSNAELAVETMCLKYA